APPVAKTAALRRASLASWVWAPSSCSRSSTRASGSSGRSSAAPCTTSSRRWWAASSWTSNRSGLVSRERGAPRGRRVLDQIQQLQGNVVFARQLPDLQDVVEAEAGRAARRPSDRLLQRRHLDD